VPGIEPSSMDNTILIRPDSPEVASESPRLLFIYNAGEVNHLKGYVVVESHTEPTMSGLSMLRAWPNTAEIPFNSNDSPT
jgi:hypothetical protein